MKKPLSMTKAFLPLIGAVIAGALVVAVGAMHGVIAEDTGAMGRFVMPGLENGTRVEWQDRELVVKGSEAAHAGRLLEIKNWSIVIVKDDGELLEIGLSHFQPFTQKMIGQEIEIMTVRAYQWMRLDSDKPESYSDPVFWEEVVTEAWVADNLPIPEPEPGAPTPDNPATGKAPEIPIPDFMLDN